ncbi:dihydroorotase [Herbinix luporum]|uniref:Dihydroorotase n=1 Tax=Herbinix luporum TaxID=1679721 RepID=A0A0K8J6R7_9FIRM|nr:dihydroorotase [Herbinix luporum]MDI9488267.1 dihydroorotase [Bacillota bacterium]CUH93306.1 Dihydroorotase [Herbinix luporum]
MITLIKNGYVVDPASAREGKFDILIKDDRVLKVEANIKPDDYKIKVDKVIEAGGKFVMPGFIDLHVHLREPGYEYKETILTGSLAAACGGFTTICAMPNTNPALDNPDTLKYVFDQAERGLVNIYPIAAITKGQEGRELNNIAELVKAGAVAISEDGKSVMDTLLYYKAMEEAAKIGVSVFAHCEDKSLAADGVMNAGEKADELGLPGISNAVEDIITARDVLMAKETGAKLHLCHCSTKGSTFILDMAKQKGINITGETCPHYFTLSDKDIPEDDANYKMNPPLRSPEDVEAIKNALKNDILDVIATDHAPHSMEEKEESMLKAPFGIVGLETAFSITWTELVKTGILSYRQLVEKMSLNPAKILNIDRGCIGEGSVADIVIIDPDKEYTIDKNEFFSMGKNTPFHGKKVYGKVLYTIVSGQVKYEYANS